MPTPLSWYFQVGPTHLLHISETWPWGRKAIQRYSSLLCSSPRSPVCWRAAALLTHVWVWHVWGRSRWAEMFFSTAASTAPQRHHRYTQQDQDPWMPTGIWMVSNYFNRKITQGRQSQSAPWSERSNRAKLMCWGLGGLSSLEEPSGGILKRSGFLKRLQP